MQLRRLHLIELGPQLNGRSGGAPSTPLGSMSEDSRPLRVVTYAQTCLAVPSQWEGTLEDGRMFYVRFRHGKFRVRVSPMPTTDVMDAVRTAPLADQQIDRLQDGFMEEAEMQERAAAVLDFNGSTRLEFED